MVSIWADIETKLKFIFLKLHLLDVPCDWNFSFFFSKRTYQAPFNFFPLFVHCKDNNEISGLVYFRDNPWHLPQTIIPCPTDTHRCNLVHLMIEEDLMDGRKITFEYGRRIRLKWELT